MILDMPRSRLLILISGLALLVLTFHAINRSTALRPYLSSSLPSSVEQAPSLSPKDPVSIVYDPRTEQQPGTDGQRSRPDVAKVSMLYGENELYVRAIDTHVRHARRHGYPAYVLRKEMIGGIWNKLLFLIYVMVAEIHKGDEGARWIMWVASLSLFCLIY